ncbi:XdhC family protein [Terriglobus aquaticus]|nr:XdhC/CoxI family protein [Terriglobus aquaticus]
MWRAGRAAALATLVAIDGSSYRRPGARLMIATDGGFAGSISGGCLETEIARKARWLVRDGATVERYSTALDENDIPFGLGCGGTVHVLLEPAGTPEFESLMLALEGTLQGQAADVYTTLPSEGRAFSRIVLPQTGMPLQHPADPLAHHEHLASPPRLLIFGAGNDAQPLVNMAALLGWRVVVIDGRAQWARPERFPAAERVVVASPTSLSFAIAPDDFAVVMTHSFDQDRDWLQALLPLHLPYLGLLGARHRSARLAGDLATLLQWPLDTVCASLRAPVGLDLGGDGAEAIALSVIAEIQACAANKSSLSRRMSADAALQEIARPDRAAFIPSSCAI